MIDQKSEHFAWPLPHPINLLQEDVLRLRTAIGLIDGMMYWAATLLNSDDPVLGTMQAVVNALKAHTTALGGKQATLTGAATTIASTDLTASRALAADGNGKVAASTVTSTELGYLSGVTSAIQTQLGGLQTQLGGLQTQLGGLQTQLGGLSKAKIFFLAGG